VVVNLIQPVIHLGKPVIHPGKSVTHRFYNRRVTRLKRLDTSLYRRQTGFNSFLDRSVRHE
jgi:hypothetical protein